MGAGDVHISLANVHELSAEDQVPSSSHAMHFTPLDPRIDATSPRCLPAVLWLCLISKWARPSEISLDQTTRQRLLRDLFEDYNSELLPSDSSPVDVSMSYPIVALIDLVCLQDNNRCSKKTHRERST